MSRETVILHYDGPALADHKMDVAYLAPALYALGDLCKVANRTFNGERAAVRVLVNVDREQNSFEFGIEIVQSLLEQTRALLDNDRGQDAKELAEWLGLLGVPTVGYGLFRLLKWLGGRPAEFEAVEDQDGRDVFRVTVNGDNNNVIVAPETKALYEERTARQSAKRILEPLKDEGYERLEFLNNGEVTESFNSDEAAGILRMPDAPPGSDEEEPQTIKAWIKVYAPTFNENAKSWRFQFGDSFPWMDISETSIASDAIKRGGVRVGDSYHVRLQITQVEQESGNFTNQYKVKEVLDFKPGHGGTQEVMSFDDPEA